MHALIVSPFLDNYIVVRPGWRNGVKIPYLRYQELTQALPGDIIPTWLTEAACRAWGLDLSGRTIAGTVLVRSESPFGYGRASYELNLGCNYDCEHCYLGLKRFEGLSWPDRERLLSILRDAGVLWLQLTGGEPMIDRMFTQVYSLAYDLGMMLTILSNGSRLSNPKILDLLTSRRPHRITLSVYGASAESYDGLTRRKGAFKMFERGLYAGHEAGLPLAPSRTCVHAPLAMTTRSDQGPRRQQARRGLVYPIRWLRC
ncbi:MAG TPA: radical SAM protein [Pseudonocardiaceae bacterium]|nr:radical SAM protein [Pseudonocardiaceae bacterium]